MRWLRPPPVATSLERLIGVGWALFHAAAMVLLLVLVIGGSTNTLPQRAREVPWTIVLLGYILLVVLIRVLHSTVRRRCLKLLEQCRYRICPACRYPLAGLGEADMCPECGNHFDPEQLRRIWLRAYQGRHWLYG